MSGIASPGKPSRIVVFAATAVVLCGLYLARDVLIPFALTVLLAFLLAPLVRRLQRWGLGRVTAVTLVMLTAISVVAAVFVVVAVQAADLLSKIPTYSENLHDKLDPLVRSASRLGRSAIQTTASLMHPVDGGELAVASAPATTQAVSAEPTVGDVLLAQGSALLRPLATAGIVTVLVAFALLQRQDLRDRFIRLIGLGRIHVATEALDEASNRVSNYLLTQTLVNGGFGAVVAIGLLLIGVPNALLWGLLAGLLRFIPYFGAWVAAAMPVLLSLGYFEDWSRPLAVIGFFVVIELVLNNVVEPWLFGARTGLSPLAVLIAAIFWTWLWGPVGLLLAIPLTVCLLVLGKYVPEAGFLHVMLGDAPVFDPDSRFYQRLLAMEHEDALAIVEQAARETDLLFAFDSIVVPAMARASQDEARGELDDHRRQFVHAAIREMLPELAEQFPPPQGAGPPPNTETDARYACVPVRSDTDALAAELFCHAARMSGLNVRPAGLNDLLARAESSVVRAQPDVVIVSVVPPSSVSQARHVVRRLTSALPGASILVGLWTLPTSSEQRMADRIGGGASVRVATTFARALAHLTAIETRPAAADRVAPTAADPSLPNSPALAAPPSA